MKRTTVVLILVVLIFSLSSCALSSILTYPGSDDKLMRECADQLFNAVKSNDREKVKSSFSPNVYIDDDSVDRLLSYIQGSVISWKEDGSPVCYDSSGEYGRVKELIFWYGLTTDKEEYMVYFYDVAVDTANDDNKGIRSLMIIRKDEESKLTGNIDDWAKTPGITIPFYDFGTISS